MKKRYLLLIILVLLSVLIYYVLGGFKAVEKKIVDNPEVNILGTYYRGEINSDQLKDLFMQSKTLVEMEENAEKIAIVYFGDADPETGAVVNFIGVVVKDSVKSAIPLNWEYLTITSSKSVRGCIEANVLVMPTPDDMLQELKEFAAQNEVPADSIFIEYYAGPNNLCVEILAPKP